jgi:L-threonylcarbamoyladenylate synthase
LSIGTGVAVAAEWLRRGALIGIPTETVYGLAANAFDPEAVLRIFEVKRRPAFDPLIVHVHHADQLAELVTAVPDDARALMSHFWPGPLTLVLPKTMRVPDIVTSGLEAVAVRMPQHEMTLALLRSLDFPLAAPSANPFGYVSPTTAQHVVDQLGTSVPFVLDGGPCAVGLESTIIGWEGVDPVLYRPGGLALERIEAVIGAVRLQVNQTKPATRVLPVAPGMIESHYAPKKPLFQGDVKQLLARQSGRRVGVISLSRRFEGAVCEVLSESGDLIEAARNLFAAMRRLDAAEIDCMLAEVFPEKGLGRAINDRLRRASAASEPA